LNYKVQTLSALILFVFLVLWWVWPLW